MNKALSTIEKRRITLEKKGRYTGYTCYCCKKRIYENMGLRMWSDKVYCKACKDFVRKIEAEYLEILKSCCDDEMNGGGNL